MRVVNLSDAMTNLSNLVDAIESGRETEIVITRNGKPAAKLIAVAAQLTKRQPLGFLDGKFPSMSLEEFNSSNEEIERLFYGEKVRR